MLDLSTITILPNLPKTNMPGTFFSQKFNCFPKEKGKKESTFPATL